MIERIAAAGRAAFTNYVGASIILTTLFYGYGAGLYGRFGRVEVYGFVFLLWSLMLLWSRPWLKRFRSEENTSELQSLMRISYAVFCLQNNQDQRTPYYTDNKKTQIKNISQSTK